MNSKVILAKDLTDYAGADWDVIDTSGIKNMLVVITIASISVDPSGHDIFLTFRADDGSNTYNYDVFTRNVAHFAGYPQQWTFEIGPNGNDVKNSLGMKLKPILQLGDDFTITGGQLTCYGSNVQR